MTRARAEELRSVAPPTAAAPRGARAPSDFRTVLRTMPGDVKLLLATSALVLLAGLGWLGFGPRSDPYPAVLGYVDAGPPKPPRAGGPQAPPFKLPWWK